MQASTAPAGTAFPPRFAAAPLGYSPVMSESGIEVGEAERLEQVQGADPDPALADDIGPEPSPVTAEQLAAGKDAVPVDGAEQGEPHELAEQSHHDAGPGQEHPE